ncbi:TPA: Arc family DNA-binding protein [Klebsiella pneumoniae]|uniref:Arc family DNA-binding protein n=1 Tax=Klebsiella pneumoniae TaxID=573 RepID=UPI000DE5CDB4|nr:Arc family DNA-binding protein [Klebsiella pneumoniae]THM40959.1 Arc family DNA-binding protein [Klebsiella pneumoniae]UVN35714.1 Arc family DNA-binding protein [Klebsiella pneumoniae]SSI97794.1 Arc-like DNA binding domain protein [Klebsiella pneumoniae]HBT3209165.1 Arc family DNA-binding protein [Klebsiella pneumoniae]HBT3396775.1 Arc family DNA-binding protein [Klebsiella pneumoniae]
MSEKPVREYDKFMLRFPDGMRDAIAERAKRNGRSMNSEIVQILQDTLDGGFSLQMDTEFGKVYNDLISTEVKTAEDFDKNNERIDWLIDQLVWKIDTDAAKLRELMNLRKIANECKKPT